MAVSVGFRASQTVSCAASAAYSLDSLVISFAVCL